jgi:phosphohistidine phosphatase
VRHLLVLRHGKSDWKADHQSDHDRTLTKRGRKSAQLMGRYLSMLGQAPDLILTSSAVRARTTAELAVEAGRWTCPLEVSPDLYGASPADVLRCIATQDDRVTRLLVVGHEPTLSEFTSNLVGGGHIHFPTAALACVGLDVDEWRAVRFGMGILHWLVVPRAVAAFADA